MKLLLRLSGLLLALALLQLTACTTTRPPTHFVSHLVLPARWPQQTCQQHPASFYALPRTY